MPTMAAGSQPAAGGHQLRPAGAVVREGPERADEQLGGADVGPVVHPHRLVADEQQHTERGGEQAAQGEGQHVAPADADRGGHHEREQQVELLLDRQAPRVEQRRRVEGDARRSPPRSRGSASWRRRRRSPACRRAGRSSWPGVPKRRAATSTASSTTASAANRRRARRAQKRRRSIAPVARVLGDEQRGDEEAREGEERRDAEEPTREPGRAEVVDDDADHGEAPQAVPAGDGLEPGASGRRPGGRTLARRGRGRTLQRRSGHAHRRARHLVLSEE